MALFNRSRKDQASVRKVVLPNMKETNKKLFSFAHHINSDKSSKTMVMAYAIVMIIERLLKKVKQKKELKSYICIILF